MELDKIIYDKDKLAQALTDQLIAESPTFNAMYPSDTATALVNVLAAYGSMMNYFFASAMANCYTDSAFSDTGIRQLAKTLGNRLHGNEPAQTFITIKKNNLQAKDISIPAYSSFTINNKKFFNPSAVILSATNPVVTQVPLIQGEIVSVDKVTSGIAGEKLYFSSDYKASMNYTTVTVGESQWEIVDSFLPYDENYVEDTSEMDKVVLETEADGRCYIKFGDGVLGTLPANGTAVNIKYVSNDGELGNVPQVNLECTLTTPLVYVNSLNNQEALDITAYTTSTIYGGFGKQSIETLRLTSPQVFASGHRAIRRNDYVSLLLNQCGYLTASVWGEYEEAQYKGAYDALMMNMVYYSGIKSFESYSDYEIGSIDNIRNFLSASNTTRAFWGTYLLKINNLTNSDKVIEIRDSGAKGLLFINDNNLDKRDSFLTPWTTGNISISTNDQNIVYPIVNARSDHKDSEYYASDDATISLLTPKQFLIDCTANPKTLAAVKFRTNNSNNPFISVFSIYGTNDITSATIGEDWRTNSLFQNIRNSANWDNITGRITLSYPGAQKWTNWIPTNLDIDLNADESHKTYNYYMIEVYDTTKDVGIGESELIINKIKGLFIEDASTIKYDENGKIVINFPKAGDSGASENSIITASNITNVGEDYRVGDILKVIDDTDASSGPIDTTLRIKVTEVTADGGISGYEWLNGVNYYPRNIISEFYDNTELTLTPETLSCIGTGAKITVSSKYSTLLVEDLIGSEDYPIYHYIPEYDGITRTNGYRSGNQLAYIYSDTDTNKNTLFVVNVDNVDTGAFTTCLGKDIPVSVTAEGTDLDYSILDYNFNESSNLVLVGNSYIDVQAPVSLDDVVVYKFTSSVLDKTQDSGDVGYSAGDTLKVMVRTQAEGETEVTYSDTGARIQVDTVNGGVITSFHWKTPYITTGNLNGLVAHTEPDDASAGEGFTFTIKTECMSGNTNGQGSGATIKVNSENNLQVTASFTGNRIDTNDINKIDQPIINKYNHFTTYTEFVQPEANPISITLDVELDTSSSRSSGIIIQEIKNAVASLFEIKPNFLGSGLKISDIYTAVMGVPSVKWCLVTSPTNNVEVKQNELMTLQSVTVNEIIKEFK